MEEKAPILSRSGKLRCGLFPDTELKISGDRRFLRAYRHCSDTFAMPPQHSSTQDHAAREVGSWGLLDSRSLGNPFTSNTRLPLLIHRTQETEPKRNAGRPSWPSGPPTGYFFFPAPFKSFHFTGGKFPHSVTTPERGPNKVTWEFITHP